MHVHISHRPSNLFTRHALHRPALRLPRLGHNYSTISTTPTASTKGLRVLLSSVHDPLFNLATEDWLFRKGEIDQQTLFLWRNAPTVVIGRNQNPWKECALHQMEKEGVTLARRQSGGGAVYQDLGNTCFTFLSSLKSWDKMKNTGIVCEALKTFGVKAEPSGRNDILVDGLKISGSAYKIAGQKAFHHGTLLINVDMDALTRLLNPNKMKLQSKGVESVRRRVVNLQELNKDITHENLSKEIIQTFFKTYGDTCEVEELDFEELKKVESLNKMYLELQDWKWRFGETPKFQHNLETRFDWGIMDIHIDSDDGVITKVQVFSDSLHPSMVDAVRNALHGQTYDKSGIKMAMSKAYLEVKQEDGDAAQHIQELEAWLLEAI